jgi:hypothetical protein
VRALLFLLLSLTFAGAAQGADAITGRVVKVLPFLLDQQGRNALSPSLFDRDAYQAVLREQTNRVSGMRFDVLWKATPAPDETIKLTVDLRGTGTNSVPRIQTLETNVIPASTRQWTELPLTGAAYRNLGRLVAWRVSLWNGGQLLGEQKSFLW